MKVVGVPEHFNLPWYELSDSGVVDWTPVPEGTGKMLDQLAARDVDLALLLTEGAVAGIAQGQPVRILGAYVDSPVVWGVHVAANGALTQPADLVGQRFAISRYSSGSHLMAGVYAREQQWPTAPQDFVVVNTLAGARQALPTGEADIFLWEKLTTQFCVDAGEFRRIDEIPTPWPALVACIHADASADEQATAERTLQLALARAQEIRLRATVVDDIARRFQLDRAGVRQWLSLTRWSADGVISDEVLTATADTLVEAGLLANRPEVTALRPRPSTMRNDL
ncbi:MAG: ABC transporter substrate-binding protein [Pseudomonadota bacterium]